MRKWTTICAVVTASLLPAIASAADSRFVGCWDETFAYNVANILQVDDGFEITMNGSTLHGDPIRTQDGVEFQLDSPDDGRFIWHSELGVYVKLPPGACSIDPVAQTAHCRVNIPAATSYRTAFVTWRQSDIDGSGAVADAPIVGMRTAGDLSQVSFDLSEGGARISFTSNIENMPPTTTTVRVDPYETLGHLVCNLTLDSGADYLTRGFPDRLRAYLQRH